MVFDPELVKEGKSVVRLPGLGPYEMLWGLHVALCELPFLSMVVWRLATGHS